MKTFNVHTTEQGFSLLELVVAVSIMLILAVVGFISYQSFTDNARHAAVERAANDVFIAAQAQLLPASQTVSTQEHQVKDTSNNHTAVFASARTPLPSSSPASIIADIESQYNSTSDEIKVNIDYDATVLTVTATGWEEYVAVRSTDPTLNGTTGDDDVLQDTTTFTTVDAKSYYHSCGLAGGKAYCWGMNSHGQLGDGSKTDRTTPVAVDTSGVLNGKTLVEISTGRVNTVALDSEGNAYTWGDNEFGQLGDGTFESSLVPVEVDTSGVLAGKHLEYITVGYGDVFVLDSDGIAYSWGRNNHGQLGDGTKEHQPYPVAFDEETNVLANTPLQKISNTGSFTLALDMDGKLWTWGHNNRGQMGDGTNTNSPFPVPVDTSGVLADKYIVDIFTGHYHAVALDSDGEAYAWGMNSHGQLGDGTLTQQDSPVAVDMSGVLNDATIVDVRLGRSHTLAIDSTGKLYAWGQNSSGELGVPDISYSNVPVEVDMSGVLNGKNILEINAGNAYNVVLDDQGTMYSWGNNTNGRLGDGSRTHSATPVIVQEPKTTDE